MIGSLRGTLEELELSGDHAAQVLVVVGGVGYEVTISTRHAALLPELSSDIDLSVHTHVREGVLQLFGFRDRTERRWFELLLQAHGVGPTLALSVLGVLGPEELLRAITGADLDALMLVPGIGKKTAQRLQLELAQRLDSLGVAPGLAEPLAGSSPVHVELREALAALGYAPEEIRAALLDLPESGTLEILLRLALSRLAPQR